MVARRLFVGEGARRRVQERAQRYHPHVDDEVAATLITLPIGLEEVYAVASKGFPVWEPIPVLQLRNRRITIAYADLSRRLATMIAGEDEKRWDANWCSFATWSSKTIGDSISDKPDSEQLARTLATLPPRLRRSTIHALDRALGSGHGAMFRSLALGNRFVFLEIATAVASLLRFVERGSNDDESGFDVECDRIVADLRRLQQLDPSWVVPRPVDPLPLLEGLRAYLRASHAEDAKRRSELVLVGNIFLAAYEQRRVQIYVGTAFSLFTAAALRRIVRGKSSRYGPALLQRLSWAYGWFVTRSFLELDLAGDILRIGRRIPSPPPNQMESLVFPAELTWIEDPVLQALLTRYDLAEGRRDRTYANNWLRYADRMNYIVNLFRGYQRYSELFKPPFDSDIALQLLAGRLPDR